MVPGTVGMIFWHQEEVPALQVNPTWLQSTLGWCRVSLEVLTQYCSMYYLRLKMVISFLRFEIFWESLFTFLLQKLHFDTSQTVLEKRISQNNAKGFKSKQTLLSFHRKCKSKNISTTEIDTKLTLGLIFCQIFQLKA